MSIDRRTFSLPRLLAVFIAAIATLLFPAPRSNAQSPAFPHSAASPATPQPWKIVFDRKMTARRRVFDDWTTPINIFAVNMDNPSAELELTNDNLSTRPVWSPDGKKIAFVRGGYYGGVFVMDADGTNVRRVSEVLDAVTLTWSPNLKYLAFDMQPSGRYIGALNEFDYPMYLIDLESDAPPRRLVSKGVSPSWSPDSAQIAYTCDHTISANKWDRAVCVISLNPPSTPRTLIDQAQSPSWSPDGKRILYISTANPKPELFVSRADGSRPQRISDRRYDVIEAAWSPNGKQIAFTSTRSMDGYSSEPVYFETGPAKIPEGGTRPFSHKVPELFIANADGSRTIQIGARRALHCNQFSWSPDSVFIAGICGSGFDDSHGVSGLSPADSIFLLDIIKPNSKPRIIARSGVESMNSAPAVSR